MPDLSQLPGIPLHDDEPVFSEPWEAQAFALVVGMHERGMFDWREWAEILGEVIKADRNNRTYYELWLEAVGLLVVRQNLLTESEIEKRTSDWQEALLSTPHGQPIELPNSTK